MYSKVQHIIGKSIIHILLIDSKDEQLNYIRSILDQVENFNYTIDRKSNVEEGLSEIVKKPINIVILSLRGNEPDDSILIETACNFIPDIAIIVLTAYHNVELEIAAMKAGAEDFIVKEDINPNLLIRSIVYSMERKKLRKQLEYARLEQQQKRENQRYDDFFNTKNTSITAQLFGDDPVAKSVPELFNRLVTLYEAFIDLAVEEQIYKVNNNLSREVMLFSEQLGFLKATPQDIVEVHSQALKNKMKVFNPQKLKVYTEEARLLLIEIMGYLAMHYRKYCIGAQREKRDVIIEENTEKG